jgi:hypothetical protein
MKLLSIPFDYRNIGYCNIRYDILMQCIDWLLIHNALIGVDTQCIVYLQFNS